MLLASWRVVLVVRGGRSLLNFNFARATRLECIREPCADRPYETLMIVPCRSSVTSSVRTSGWKPEDTTTLPNED